MGHNKSGAKHDNTETIAKANRYIKTAYRNNGGVIPSVEGLSLYLEVSKQTLYNWRDKDDIWLDVLNRINTKQHDKLISKGLDGSFNPTITKLILTKHGYSDRHDHTSKGERVVVLPQTIIDKNTLEAAYK